MPTSPPLIGQHLIDRCRSLVYARRLPGDADCATRRAEFIGAELRGHRRPQIWRILNMPSQRTYAPSDELLAIELEDYLFQLRVLFHRTESVAELREAILLLRAVDRYLERRSIGVRFKGRLIEGEAIA